MTGFIRRSGRERYRRSAWGIISTDPARHRDMRDTPSLIANDDIGRGGMLHSDDVVAGIDMVNLARDAAR